MAQSKAHDFAVDAVGRPLIEQTKTLPILPSRWLRRDLIAPAGPNEKPLYRLIIAVSYRTLSLGHLLMGYVFGAAIRIAYDDRDGGDEDGRDGVRRVA